MPDIAAAHAALVEELRQARELFDNDRQAGATVAASAVLEFVGATVPNDRLHAPLFALVGALLDVSEGRASTLLRPKENDSHASRTPAEREVHIGRAAAVVTLLMWAGDTLDVAARKVSRALQNRITAGSIKDARKRITRGDDKRKAGTLAVTNYDGALSVAKSAQANGVSPAKVAADALAHLATTVLIAPKVE